MSKIQFNMAEIYNCQQDTDTDTDTDTLILILLLFYNVKLSYEQCTCDF